MDSGFAEINSKHFHWFLFLFLVWDLPWDEMLFFSFAFVLPFGITSLWGFGSFGFGSQGFVGILDRTCQGLTFKGLGLGISLAIQSSVI